MFLNEVEKFVQQQLIGEHQCRQRVVVNLGPVDIPGVYVLQYNTKGRGMYVGLLEYYWAVWLSLNPAAGEGDVKVGRAGAEKASVSGKILSAMPFTNLDDKIMVQLRLEKFGEILGETYGCHDFAIELTSWNKRQFVFVKQATHDAHVDERQVLYSPEGMIPLCQG